jgi:hypothetical protein
MPFVWIGLNTFLIYLLAATDWFDDFGEWIYYNGQSNNVINLAYNHIFCLNAPDVRIHIFVCFSLDSFEVIMWLFSARFVDPCSIAMHPSGRV